LYTDKFTINDISNLKNFASEVFIPNQKKFALLIGDLGAGKTTFVSIVSELIGIKDSVSSPTFSIINRYRGINGKDIYHIDLYRLNSLDELEMTGFYDLIKTDAYFFIEWADKFNLSAELNDYMLIKIDVIDENQREISISYEN